MFRKTPDTLSKYSTVIGRKCNTSATTGEKAAHPTKTDRKAISKSRPETPPHSRKRMACSTCGYSSWKVRVFNFCFQCMLWSNYPGPPRCPGIWLWSSKCVKLVLNVLLAANANCFVSTYQKSQVTPIPTWNLLQNRLAQQMMLMMPVMLMGNAFTRNSWIWSTQWCTMLTAKRLIVQPLKRANATSMCYRASNPFQTIETIARTFWFDLPAALCLPLIDNATKRLLLAWNVHIFQLLWYTFTSTRFWWPISLGWKLWCFSFSLAASCVRFLMARRCILAFSAWRLEVFLFSFGW